MYAGGALPAAAAAPERAPLQLPEASVEDEAVQPYKAEAPESPKFTAPLLDTPQTVTIIPATVIRDQNLLTLRDILSTVPGITFGAGEGGGGYGDSVTLRGYSANSDITVDGVRDSAQYTRSDPFNLEQVEVVNGANSAQNGSGAVGGSINLVSKQAREDNLTTIGGSVGTDNYFRGTIDSNEMITDTTAVRLNVMGHMNDVPGRDVEEYKRWGVAGSVALGLGTPTRLTLNVLHQRDDNIPQYGVPYFKTALFDGPLPGVASRAFFGFSNVDTQISNIDQFTAILSHDFSDTMSVRNLARYQQVKMFSRVIQPQGTFCVAGPAGAVQGVNPATGAACTPVGTFVAGVSGTTRDTKNTLAYNQTDLMMKFNTAGLSHSTVAGFAISYETYALGNGVSLRNPGGALPNPVLPTRQLNNLRATEVWTGPINFVQSGSANGTSRNPAVYAFDTVNLTPQFELNLGLRYEYSEGTITNGTYNANGAFTSQTPVFKNSDTLFSYRAGLVYKPIEDASVYVAYGNSKTPSKASVGGSCTTGTFGTATFVNNCNVNPEEAVNIEIGGKWNLLEDRLSATAALFRNERSNYRVPSNDPTVPDQVLDGKSRVDGVALGLAGTMTEEWQVFTNYTYLKSKVVQSVSDFCLVNRTTPACVTAIAAAPVPGNPLTQTPAHAFSLWTTYRLPYGFQIGYGATYQGKIFLNNAAPPLYTAPGYWVHRAMVGYAFNDNLTFQLNANNLFDKVYYTRVRYTATSPWATPADGRSVVLSANYAF